MNVDVLLCFELPFLTDELRQEWRECKNDKERERNIEKRTDLFATMLALYPYTETEVLEKQLGISAQRIKEYCGIIGVRKSKEYRSEINRKNGSLHNPKTKPIEKVARNGRVVATYKSVSEAARENGYSDKTISFYCNRQSRRLKGYKYRYKKE